MSKSAKPVIRVAVFDDDRGRDVIYRLFFDEYSSSELSHFEVQVIIPDAPRNAIRAVKASAADVIIMDVLLKRHGWSAEQVDDLVKLTGKSNIPLGFVSSDMGQEAAIAEMRSIASSLSANPKIGYFTYVDTFRRHLFDINPTTNALERTTSRLREEVISLWNVIFMGIGGSVGDYRKEPTSSLTFLHLTDTHFGKVDVQELSVEGVVDVIRNNSIHVDGLVWTGDIADKGFPSDYAKASQFYNLLVSKGALNQAGPVFAIAGNHDHCWPLALSANLIYSNNRWVLGDSPNPDLLQLAPYRTQPFSEFYETITGRRMEVFREGFKWIDDFKESGLLILEFSVEEFRVAEIDTGERRDIDNACGRILDELRRLIYEAQDATFVILVLIHGREPGVIVENQLKVFIHRLTSKGYPIIVAGGHYHVGTSAPEGSVLYVVGSPMSEKVVDTKAVLPGISFITVDTSKLPRAFCEITTYKLEQNAGGVLENNYIVREKFQTRDDSARFSGHWLAVD